MIKKKILVVDDEVMLVDLIKMRLEINDYEVTTAHDGFGGLIRAKTDRPDLIILDISMAGMDGYTMLKEVRHMEGIKDTKVVMLTASGKNRDLFEAEGISDYITKPFDTEDFVSRIGKIVQNGKVVEEKIKKSAKIIKTAKVAKVAKVKKAKKTVKTVKAKKVKKVKKVTKVKKAKKAKKAK